MSEAASVKDARDALESEIRTLVRCVQRATEAKHQLMQAERDAELQHARVLGCITTLGQAHAAERQP